MSPGLGTRLVSCTRLVQLVSMCWVTIVCGVSIHLVGDSLPTSQQIVGHLWMWCNFGECTTTVSLRLVTGQSLAVPVITVCLCGLFITFILSYLAIAARLRLSVVLVVVCTFQVPFLVSYVCLSCYLALFWLSLRAFSCFLPENLEYAAHSLNFHTLIMYVAEITLYVLWKRV